MSHVLYVDNVNLIELAGLQDELTGDFVNAATVAVTLKDANGANVTGQVWPLTMPYITDSDGLYRVMLVNTLPLLDNARYTAVVTADDGALLRGKWELDCLAKTRR